MGQAAAAASGDDSDDSSMMTVILVVGGVVIIGLVGYIVGQRSHQKSSVPVHQFTNPVYTGNTQSPGYNMQGTGAPRDHMYETAAQVAPERRRSTPVDMGDAD